MTLLWRHHVPSYLCLLCLGACFSVDPHLITPDDAAVHASLDGASPDAGDIAPDEDADSPVEDAEAHRDAAAPDAMVLDPVAFEAGVVDSDSQDATRDVAPSFCDSDADCTTTQYCSELSRQCEPRCDAKLGCAQPIWPFENTVDFSLIAADHHVYWGSSRTSDGAGNPRDDAKIWSWDLKTEPKVVATNVCGFPYFVLDGYVYCHLEAGRTGLARVRSDGSGGAQVLITSGVTKAWSTEEYVWWSSTADTPAKLWRLARSGTGQSEQVPVADRPGEIITGNASSIFRLGLNPDDQLGVESLGGSQFSAIAHADCYPYMRYAIDAQAVYCTTWEGLKRTPFDGSDLPKFLYKNASYKWGGSVQLAGDYAYWSFGSESQGVVIGRTHKLLETDPEQIVLTVGKAGATGFTDFAWLDGQLVYFNAREGRLFVKAVP